MSERCPKCGANWGDKWGAHPIESHDIVVCTYLGCVIAGGQPIKPSQWMRLTGAEQDHIRALRGLSELPAPEKVA
jgi:hypothetical protein